MRYTITLWDDPEKPGKVKMEVTPPVDQATAASHIAKLKVDGIGHGEAFGYVIACLDTMMRRSKGIGPTEQARPSILWTPDSGAMS